MPLPLDPFGRSRLPADFSRAGRIALLGQACDDLLAGRPLSAEARMFLGSALAGWLSSGGSLERDYLRVRGPAGSHKTPAAVWCELRSSSRGATDAGGADTFEESNLEGNQ